MRWQTEGTDATTIRDPVKWRGMLNPPGFAPIHDAARRLLIELAREALTTGACRPFDAEDEAAAPLLLCRGVFVTLRLRGRLRGCVGMVQPDAPLGRAVQECAISAAVDPRFPPLADGERLLAEIEISVLSSSRRVFGPGEIRIGADGIIVTQGARRGLLLPKVAVEQKWSAARLLEETCLKAGLSATAWKEGAVVESFEAEVFGDEDPGSGEIPT